MFQIDVNVTAVYISSISENPSIKVQGTLGPIEVQTVYKDTREAFYSFEPDQPGAYTVSV